LEAVFTFAADQSISKRVSPSIPHFYLLPVPMSSAVPDQSTVTRVSTSWDDGDRDNLRMADLLDRHGLLGTFYIAVNCPAGPGMSTAEIRELSGRHEIGAHTIDHVRLDLVTTAQAKEQIEGSKKWLEDVTGEPISAFCYPWGKWTPRVVDLVREAGFAYGRTVQHLVMPEPSDPMLQGTTCQTVLQPYYLPRLARLLISRPAALSRITTDADYLDRAFALAQEFGSGFHVWGHTWEVTERSQWERLDAFFGRLAARSDVRATTNSGLL
jgi:peptidoglycan/xylan/chitin deacetylase (PgdA/CDA1 family)